MSVMFLSVTLISLLPYFSPFFKSSSLSRKLDKIHDLLLKKADDQLYYRLKELSIPPQTYGMHVNINYVRSLLL